MMILKKKEIIAASLVVLIGLAGYLNWSYQDTIRVSDNESYVATGKTLGAAEMVSSNNEVTEETSEEPTKTEEAKTTGSDEVSENNNNEGGENYFEDAKMNRESARAATMETLKQTSTDTSIDEETRRLAGEKLIQCTENIEIESKLENIAAAKGYKDVCVYISDGTADVTVKYDNFSSEDAMRLTDIVTSTAGISADKVKVIEVK